MEVFVDAISVMITGMLIVFAVLILLLFIVKSLKLISGNKADNVTADKNVDVPVVLETQTESVNNNNILNDHELIAVITAAIAASIGVSPDRLVVRSLRNANGNDNSAWRAAAKSEKLFSILEKR